MSRQVHLQLARAVRDDGCGNWSKQHFTGGSERGFFSDGYGLTGVQPDWIASEHPQRLKSHP